ncbi:MAG: FISUMP domain-containing protein [Candidatus Saccharibacteria bacterium]|nr:FISUMP domain-containing protein [Candidatus Saccharibacteria bacterium]
MQENPQFYLLAALLSITAISGSILSSTTASADNDTVVDQINITVPVSCTMSGTGMTSHTAEIANGTYTPDIGTTTLHAFCNDAEGFAIYATGYTGNEIGATNSNKLVGTPASIGNIDTGTAISGNTSNWAMKLETITSPTPTYPITIDNGFTSYSSVPNQYTKVAHRDSGTDIGAAATGATLTTTYAAYMSSTQGAGTYSGQVIYTLVHPASNHPLKYDCEPGKICYTSNGYNVIGTMGRQEAIDGGTVTLFASNFSRDGYGFAGWSDTFDYATNTNAHFYGPNEDITVPTGTTANGLSLYAVWIKSAGDMQDTAKTATVCNNLAAATVGGTRTLDSVSALTDTRDGQTYAIAKLADGRCWMIENLRLADTHQEGANTVPTTLTTTNTNNPLNDNDAANPTVTLKLNYNDTTTAAHLSPTSSVAYNVNTAPEGWCTGNSITCNNQSRLRTDNTADRVSYTVTQTMSTDANLYSYGNYYNWYSATAGRGTLSTGSGVTATGDLCPTGWHLPTGNIPGDYYAMNTAVNGDSTSSDTGLRSYPNNFLYSGYVNGVSFNGRGSAGFYWSSKAVNNDNAYVLGFYSSPPLVYPGTTFGSKYSGRPVRCLVSS